MPDNSCHKRVTQYTLTNLMGVTGIRMGKVGLKEAEGRIIVEQPLSAMADI